jgi:murein L,D-transpeptidase YafK
MNPSYSPLNRKYIRPSFIFLLFLAVILLSSIVAISYLYIKDRQQRDLLVWQVQETQKNLNQLYLSLARGDMKKAFVELEEAQKKIAAAIPPQRVAAPKSVIAQKQSPALAPRQPVAVAVTPPTVQAPVEPQARTPAKTAASQIAATAPPALVIPEGKSPFPFIIADSSEYLLVVEKDQKTLHLFRYTDHGFSLIKSYACIVGANGLDKLKEGDLATPVGNYFTLRFIPDQALPEKYGLGAFVLNYPNFLDRKARKDGTGIWLHGHTPGMSLGAPELQNTSGCIVVNNDHLSELKGFIKASGTPVVVVNTLLFSQNSYQKQLATELTDFMQSWGKSWESGKMDPFMKHYSSDFINADGMNYQSFKRQKENVNKGKKFIRVKIDNISVLLPQEKGGQIAVARFTQRYRSSNFESDTRKIFYLKKGQSGWQIIGESRL